MTFFQLWGRFLCTILLLSTQSVAQNIPLGTWRTHLSYQSATTLTISGEKVYAGSPNSLFYFDKSFNNTTKLSKIDGLSETDISRVGYLPALKMVLIAYHSGNVDLLTSSDKAGESDKITNLNVIKNASISGSKNINDITFRDNLAYLSCDFGLVVLDLQKIEVRETYRNIGFNGTPIAVFGSTFANDSIFLASSQGIMAAPLAAQINLQDFSNWHIFTPSQGIPNDNVKAIASRNGGVYAGVSGKGLYHYQQGNWTNLVALTEPIQTIRTSNNQLLVCTGSRLLTINEDEIVAEVRDNLLLAPQEAAFDMQGKLWVADAKSGLLSNRSGHFEAYIPSGPASNQAWKLYGYGGKIVALAGGFNENTQAYGRTSNFYIFDGAQWANYALLVPTTKDLVSIAYQADNQQLYLGSFGNGLFRQKADLSIETVAGSPLIASANGVRVTGLATDDEGNIWVTNHSVPLGMPSLHVFRKTNQWESFAFTQTGSNNPLGILIDDNGFKWLRLDPKSTGGILVFDEKTQRSRYLGTASGNGELPNPNVRSMAMDKEGQIWVGTDDGVAVFFNTSAVFTGGYSAFTPIFNTRRLLNDEFITAIKVDGGNRKWIGTRNGLWLFNAEGSELVVNFTTKNSPLLSNNITDIEIESTTGEVFIATDQGLLSYRGSATEAESKHTQVKVFPNPVRPNFDGLVGISGLAANSMVKITDAAGRLVYETRANGGTATWNVHDYRGNRAETGIYLIFSASDDGSETFIAKLAVVK
ncbi:MAG: two-component regulator propeller domain-containing protein [Bacteroidota bacterium]